MYVKQSSFQVGILDVESMRLRTTFRGVHKNEIYSLIWQENYIYFIVNRVLCVCNAAQSKKGKRSPLYMCCRVL